MNRSLDLDPYPLAFWAYAPSNLRYLKQPVPNGHAPSADFNIFTFEDAFEDLLAISQGNELPDIHTKYSQRQLLRQMFPYGEPQWFWLRRIQSQGLLGQPSSDEFNILSNLAHLDGYFKGVSRWPHWPRLHEELERRAAGVWNRPTSVLEGDKSNQDDESFLFDLQKFIKKIDDDFHEGVSPKTGESVSPVKQNRQPDHFDDLFAAVNSSFEEGQRSWNTFLKAVSGSRKASQDNLENPNASSEEMIDEQGNREVVTKDEYVDKLGFLHSTVTRKSFDKHGTQIGSQTHLTLHLGDKNPKSKDGHDTQVIERIDSEADNQPILEEKKAGWFWK